MNEASQDPSSLLPQEIEAMYAISRCVAGSEETEKTLEEITHLVRAVFIFDNLVLYTPGQNETLETAFVRAIGRGRSLEADLVWGETVAHSAYQSQEIVIRVEQVKRENKERTNSRYSLGLPVRLGEQMLGALVFIRFGGPEYSPQQVHLSEFVAANVAQLLDRRALVGRIANLEAHRRLDALQDDFIATISHELLTPLGFIKGYATTLLRDDIEWDEQTRREFLTIIDEESDRLRELIDDVMDSSRLQAGTLRMVFQPIRLDAILKDILLRARSRHEDMQIELNIEAPGVQVSADPTRMAQIFDNILSNAAKYAPGAPVTITLREENGRALIAIHDEGPGISPASLAQIFQRFYRAPEASTRSRGTGLGLYICRKIALALNGEIWAESQEGHGTTFTLSLPCM